MRATRGRKIGRWANRNRQYLGALVAASAWVVVYYATAGAPATSTPPTNAPASTPGPALVGPSPTLAPGYPHEAVDVEALLPAVVGSQQLIRWSADGRSYFEIVRSADPRNLSAIRGLLASRGQGRDDIIYAHAGRATLADAPFYVGAFRFRGVQASTMPLGFAIAPAPSNRWKMTNLSGRLVHVGTTEMVLQDQHVRGRPYVYNVGDIRFIVITDSEAWAADAVRQFPSDKARASW